MIDETVRAFIRRSWDILEEVSDEAWQAKRGLAKSLRELNHLVVCSDAPAEQLSEAASRVDQALALLKPHPAGTFKSRFEDGDYIARPEIYADRAWITGRSNPISPLALLDHDGSEATGEVYFDNAYVGAPGWVHGGALASVFDQIMGFVLILQGTPCVTAELTVRYHVPTPSHKPLRLKAYAESEEGRNVAIKATCHDGDVHTATATAIFARLNPQTFAAVLSTGRPR